VLKIVCRALCLSVVLGLSLKGFLFVVVWFDLLCRFRIRFRAKQWTRRTNDNGSYDSSCWTPSVERISNGIATESRKK
jgi:hypothetical protein